MAPPLRTIGFKLKPSTRFKIKPPEKRAEPFYTSPQWRQFIDALIEQRFGNRGNARCQDPQCEQPQRIGIRLFGDHIIERRDGGAEYDPSNILFRCGSCHTRKTAEERRKRLHGVPHG